MADDPKPSLNKLQFKIEKLKYWGIILAGLATLATAVSAHFKDDHKGTKEVYTELSRAVEKLSEDQIKLHRDISAIRGYLAGKAERPSSAIVEFIAPPKISGRTNKSDEPKKAIISPEPELDIPTIEEAPEKYYAPPLEQITGD